MDTALDVDHFHCPGHGCYWRIQFGPSCSRCGGATVPCDGDCDSTRRELRGNG